MPWFCNACGRLRGSPECKKRCRQQWGDMGAERIPPLDGFVELTAVDHILTEDEEKEVRSTWFNRKRS